MCVLFVCLFTNIVRGGGVKNRKSQGLGANEISSMRSPISLRQPRTFLGAAMSLHATFDVGSFAIKQQRLQNTGYVYTSFLAARAQGLLKLTQRLQGFNVSKVHENAVQI